MHSGTAAQMEANAESPRRRLRPVQAAAAARRRKGVQTVDVCRDQDTTVRARAVAAGVVPTTAGHPLAFWPRFSRRWTGLDEV